MGHGPVRSQFSQHRPEYKQQKKQDMSVALIYASAYGYSNSGAGSRGITVQASQWNRLTAIHWSHLQFKQPSKM